MSRSRPYIPNGCDYQGRMPEMAVYDPSDDDEREPTAPSRIVDFFAGCILGIAMSLMEEPSGKPTPPAYPWRALGAGLGVVFAVIAAFHIFASFWPMAMQVASK